ncbi:hypothetical protein VB796_22575 [Arcicella sp. LKC2W]|uniref:hypothetical protein n=1 Tax=Arcicella sp. LKC2W TaxID=2984198 RepID=UPI002B21131C|nr:hypothetical protein [Arcicella sp. LKC2W]MEA5461872.1 hypothetical protein [Arcicella sp. LKC2W]
MRKIILLFIAFSLASASFAQHKADSLAMLKPAKPSPPIGVEFFAGNNDLAFQMMVSKHFSPKSRFGFFNVTQFVGDYATTNQKNSFISQSFLTADIWKGFSINTGVTMNYMTGFRPSAGLQYVFANRKFTAVLLPRFDLTQTYNFETFGLVEYKPKFKNNWGLYSRVQGLYNHNTKLDTHNRSYIWLRVGASYKNYQFGLGSNFDYYGPLKINENSMGVFVRAELF